MGWTIFLWIKLDISGSGKGLILNFMRVILLRMSQEKHFESDVTQLVMLVSTMKNFANVVILSDNFREVSP